MADQIAPFDPKQDWPPEGAVAEMGGRLYRFTETTPGWWSLDGRRYARPFDCAGVVLATLWSANSSHLPPPCPYVPPDGGGQSDHCIRCSEPRSDHA